jgi:hypothetical protein
MSLSTALCRRRRAAKVLSLSRAVSAAVFFATLGHDDRRHIEANQFAVFGASEAFVEADAGEGTGAVAGEHPVGHRDALVHVCSAHRHVVVVDESVLIGGDEQAVAPLVRGPALAFLDPLGVRLDSRPAAATRALISLSRASSSNATLSRRV